MDSAMKQPFAIYGVESAEFEALAPASIQDLESDSVAVVNLPGFGMHSLAATNLQDAGSFPVSYSSVQNIESYPLSSTSLEGVELNQVPLPRPAACSNWASKEDWIRVQPLIKRLYVDEGMKLKDIITFMKEEHDFKATPKMYKDRFKNWNFGKNLKEPEVAAILRKKTQRDSVGKRSQFEIRGRAVSLEDVYRYSQRKNPALNAVRAKYINAPTPPYISCSTPPLSPSFQHEVPRSPSTPHSLLVPEELIFNINRYISISFDKNRDFNNPEFFWDTPDDLLDLYHYCKTSVALVRSQLFVEARGALSKACCLIPNILKAEDPQTIGLLMSTILDLIADGRLELATLISGYIAKMSSILLEAKQPWGKVCRLIGSVEPDHLRATLLQSYKCANNTYAHFLGQFHPVSLKSQINLISFYETKEDLFDGEKRLRELHSQYCKATAGMRPGFCSVLLALGSNLNYQGKHVEAEVVAFELFVVAQENNFVGFEVAGLSCVAKAQFNQGKMDQTVTNVRKAFELIRENNQFGYNPFAIRDMVSLKSILQECGLEEMVPELDKEVQSGMLLWKVDEDE